MSRSGRTLLLSVAATALFAGPGTAQGFLNLRTGCQDSASTQAAMSVCTETDLLAARKRLNQLLAELRTTLPALHYSGLDSAQVAWRLYTQTECAWEATAYRGGSLEAMMHSSCLEAATWHRVRELAPLLCGLDRAEPRCRVAEPYLRLARNALTRP
jgi:uncharacterized protein YecT (DUF1311 family)